MGVMTQAKLLAFDQIASYDEQKWESDLAAAKLPRM